MDSLTNCGAARLEDPTEGEKSELHRSLVYFTVQRSTRGKQPELSSLNPSHSLFESSWKHSAPGREGIADKREVSAAAGVL